ncbi:hypothetical protein [Nocardia xishanensis]
MRCAEWAQARPLDELTESLSASELEIARQLMRLGLAENSREVADRLGPGSWWVG